MMPCSLPRSWPSAQAAATTSMSRRPGPDDREDLREDGVLHGRGPADEADFLGALHHLDRVDEPGRIDDRRLAGECLG